MEPRAFSYHPIYFVSFLKVRLEFLEVEQPIRACGLGLKKKKYTVWEVSDRVFLMIMPQSDILSFQGSECIDAYQVFLLRVNYTRGLTLLKLFLLTLCRQPLRVAPHFIEGVDPPLHNT